ncbi:type II secretion system F family protein [Desulfonatronovibrio magnus]|uniref:type II secretion system F family protein n=1 Tax=Desulfonatronovibrio magnus TaxID=698827 RepID=UPI0005EB3F0D|nr:type II secretion system F family protein [Desulfonatronovibrio magnus]
MDSLLVKFLGIIIFFSSVFIFLYLSISKAKKKGSPRKEEQLFETEETRFIFAFRPLYQLLFPVIDKLPFPKYKSLIKKHIITAGLEGQITPADIIGFQATTMIIFGFIGYTFFSNWVFISIFIIVGLGFPYIWLFEKKKTRQEEIKRTMPDIVDMLSLSVEAGLAFNVAVQKVCNIFKEDKDPFVAELYLMDQNIKLGRSRQEALKIMAERVDIMEVDSFTSTLIQAEKMGSPISSVLKSQAERMRSERFMKAERLGAQASQKLLAPMMVLIFPTIFIIIFGPYIIQFIVSP